MKAVLIILGGRPIELKSVGLHAAIAEAKELVEKFSPYRNVKADVHGGVFFRLVALVEANKVIAEILIH
jgi:hypothetical protein